MASRTRSPQYSLSVAQGAEAIRRNVLEIVQQESDISLGLDQVPTSFGRLPIQVALRILPVAFDGTDILLHEGRSEPVDGQTRDVSFEGMAFDHRAELREKHFAAFFPALDRLQRALLFERLWSRRSKGTEFASGGRFIGVVAVQGPETADVERRGAERNGAGESNGKLACAAK